MRTVYQIYHEKRRARGPILAGIRRVYQVVVPNRLRYWRAKVWLFVSDPARYRHYAAERREQREFFRRAFSLWCSTISPATVSSLAAARGLIRLCLSHSAMPIAMRAGQGTRHACGLSIPSRACHRPMIPATAILFGQKEISHRPSPVSSTSVRREGIPRDRFEVVKGFYSHTLSPESPGYERLPKDAALVYVDRDLYTSTKAVMDFLTPRLKHGMIVAFDDDFCASADAIAGERLAFLKLQKAMPRFRFLP